MKLFEHQETEKTLDRLPDLPPGVEVPDDISGIHPPTTSKPTAGVRWMRWLAAIVLLGGAGVLAAVLLSDSGTDTQTPVDYMEVYGTDNPTFVEGSVGPGTVQIIAPERSYMELYGTDNPVLIPDAVEFVVVDLPSGQFWIEATVDAEAGEYMRLYGTDNPVFPPEPSYMDQFGTDNPVFVEPTFEGNMTQLPGGVSSEGTVWADLPGS